MKKSQIEMFGLLILVVLIAISLVIAIRFMMGSSQDTEVPIEPRLNSQAVNLQLALLKASVCENNNLENVLIACCNNQDICNGNACNLAKDIIKESINQTLPNQGSNVTFSMQTKECLVVTNGACEEFVSSSYPVRYAGSVYNFKVIVCKK